MPDKRITVAGFSLGGNFALRVAAKAPQAGIELERAAAVCPVLRPHSTMEVLENGWFIYQQYFLNKWKRSLRRKQQCFPKRYDFSQILAQRTIRSMTELLVRNFSEFSDLDAYLNGYAITGDALAHLQVPSHILISLDDPIIPAHDLQNLARSPNLHVTSIPQGGHCGFMDSFNGASWADRQIANIMFRRPRPLRRATPPELGRAAFEFSQHFSISRGCDQLRATRGQLSRRFARAHVVNHPSPRPAPQLRVAVGEQFLIA